MKNYVITIARENGSNEMCIRDRAHPLIQVLADNRGNPRTLVLIDPLWGVPYNLIAPFATLYMYTQGITDVQIGLILSVTMAVQVLFCLLYTSSPPARQAAPAAASQSGRCRQRRCR